MGNKKLLLIVNPYSGRAKMRGELLRVTEIFSRAGFDVTVYPTKARGDATVRISQVNQDEYDRIVVCGGDGTLNEAITGLMQSEIKCRVGYIPCGTLNEWSSGLNISRNIAAAARDATSNREITLDLGKFGDKYFTYTASFGAFTEASYSAPQDVKNVLGRAAYFFEGIKSLGNIKPLHLKFTCNGNIIEGDFLFGAITNSLSVGGIVKFNENAVNLNDGYFEVLLIRSPDTIAKFQSIVDGILRQDLNRDGIDFFKTKEITVEGGADIPWTLDGEYAQSSDKITITNISSALHLVISEN